MRHWLFLILVLIAMIAAYAITRHSAPPPLSYEPIEGTVSAPKVASPRATPVPSPDSAPLRLPDADLVRAQERESGRLTPPELLAFARRLAPRMERARSSPSEARAFFAFLRSCALNEGTNQPDSVRTLCAVNALRLASGEEARALRAALPEGVATSVDAIMND